MRVLFLISLIFTLCIASPEDIQTLYERKANLIVQDAIKTSQNIPGWLSNFTQDGSFKDVDYTAGCDGRRANWPAQQHIVRLVTMASQYYTDPSSNLLPNISKGLDYWFNRDYTQDACLDQGGLTNSTCPCGTPGLWNTNWFAQMILMPRLITNACLLIKSNLTSTQLGNCTRTGQRPLARIDTWVYGIGYMTGANMLDVATTIINLGLVTNNETTVQTGINHFYNQTLITPETGADGIKIDGAYLQHFAQLYTGNYGKDYINSVVSMYQQTEGTAYSAPDVSQHSFNVLLDGTQWMIISKSGTTNSSLLWEYSTIGRMVSFVYSDNQASGGVRLNFSQIAAATEQWTNASDIQTIVETLQPVDTQSANQGDQKGVRYFFTADYLVSRGTGYVSTLKMFSQRTTNSECNNDQNPYGFHLSDGALFSYIQGDEYLDVFAGWDWNLVPGTTVDYGNTPFGCNTTQWYGNTSFVGSVTGNVSNTADASVAVMQYLNPMTGALRWEKTYFFFPNYYAVQIGPIYSQTTAPIITTLDQSNLKGDVYVNGVKV
ncbi:polysaccharide lyase family 8 protein, partial [Backusella circina FSU 941]